jgi:adenylate kinase family enzyme
MKSKKEKKEGEMGKKRKAVVQSDNSQGTIDTCVGSEKAEGVMRLDAYLRSVSKELQETRGARGSKVEAAIKAIVDRCIEDNKPATIKAIAEELSKTTQQIHQTLKRATSVKKVKCEGRVLVVPSDME